MKIKYGFLGILIITLILTSTYPGVFLGLEWVWANNVISTVDVGDCPSALAFNPSNNNIYVANTNSNDVSVIESIPIRLFQQLMLEMVRLLWRLTQVIITSMWLMHYQMMSLL